MSIEPMSMTDLHRTVGKIVKTYHLNDNDHGIAGVEVRVELYDGSIGEVQISMAPQAMPPWMLMRLAEMFETAPETYDLIEAIDDQAAETQGDADCHAIMEGD